MLFRSRARRRFSKHHGGVNEDIEGYENSLELALFREYRDVIGLFKYVVETERRFYLCNQVDVQAHPVDGNVYFELKLDRKSTRLNSSHARISYAVFCLKKKTFLCS